MKKSLLYVLILPLVFLHTGCLSTLLSTTNQKVTIPFESTMDTRFGYEGLYWGISFDEIEKLNDYPVISYREESPYSGNYTIHYAYGRTYRDDFGSARHYLYGHGNVDSTEFYFYNKRLYKVTDKLDVKNPTLEYLHERYGEFSDENVASNFKNASSFSAIYTNDNLFPAGRTHSLQIQIAANGTTRVFMTAPYTYESLETNSSVSSFLKGGSPLTADKWYMIGSTDGKAKDFDLLFVNRNNDNVYAIIYYKKNAEPALSSLRAGFCVPSSTYGTYELKTEDGIKEVYMDRTTRVFNRIGYEISMTTNEKVSARDMINLFLTSDTLTFRKNGKVYTLQTAGLGKLLTAYGITGEELNFAIGNEEF